MNGRNRRGNDSFDKRRMLVRKLIDAIERESQWLICYSIEPKSFRSLVSQHPNNQASNPTRNEHPIIMPGGTTKHVSRFEFSPDNRTYFFDVKKLPVLHLSFAAGSYLRNQLL